MASQSPNPFRDIGPWNTLGVAGRLVKALLVEVNGVSTKDEWKAQKSKETNGQVWVFSGTTVDKPKLTLEACDAEDFDDLGDLWNVLKPVPGFTGSATPAAPTGGQQFTGAAQSKGDASSSSSGGTVNTVADPAAKASTSSSTPNPGPRPPTVSVQNAILAWHGITAIARGEWEGPMVTETNSWRVVITVVPQEQPKPAGVGAMTPAAPGSQFTGGAPDSIDKKAAAGAAGT